MPELPRMDVIEINEEWDGGKIQSVTVEIDHVSNPKTFTFTRSGGGWFSDAELTHYNMSMAADAGSHSWTKDEVETIDAAYKLAKEIAVERAALDDTISTANAR